jgi:fusion and transport protein UGO1
MLILTLAWAPPPHRLILTSTARRPRATLSTLRALPSYVIAPALLLPTILHSLLHPILTLSTPLVLRTRLMLDRDISPTAFSLAKFATSSFALLIKLPLETILRRAQVAVLSSPPYIRALDGGPATTTTKLRNRAAAAAALDESQSLSQSQSTAPTTLDAIVTLGSYNGLVGTVHSIVSEEGSRPVTSKSAARSRNAARRGKQNVAETVYRRGQGLEGLWRGWKVSWWGLVGLWAAGLLGGGGDGEF